MRSLVMACYLLTNALGSYLGAGLLGIIKALTKKTPWFPGYTNLFLQLKRFTMVNSLFATLLLGVL